MDNNNKISEIYQQVGKLQGKVDEGFYGINKRLDIMNGNVADNRKRINDLETFKDNLQGRIVIIVGVMGIIVAFIGSFLKDIVSEYLKI